jgi:hypothetical protein
MPKYILFASTLLTVAAQVQAATPQVKTVFVIALENHNFTQPAGVTSPGQLFGNPAAPYLNSLITPGAANAAQVSYASAYHNVPPQTAGSPSGAGNLHPSEPNYVWAEAGVAGPRNDADPYPSNVVNAPSLSATLAASGQSWRSYQEGIDLAKNSSGGLTNTVLSTSQYVVPLKSFSGKSTDYTNPYNGSHQYNYATKHDPQVFFTATNGGNDSTPANAQALNYAPLEQLSADLQTNSVARYNWITPDQYNDMHTALTGGFTYNGNTYTGDQAEIAQGDNFLSKIVPLIMASQAYQDNGAIVNWNDETEGETLATFNQFANPEIVISPLAKGNAYNSVISYDHSSDLRTMQEIFGISPGQGYGWLGGAASARDLSDLFQSGAIASVPEPQSWALMIGGFAIVGGAARRKSAKAASA